MPDPSIPLQLPHPFILSFSLYFCPSPSSSILSLTFSPASLSSLLNSSSGWTKRAHTFLYPRLPQPQKAAILNANACFTHALWLIYFHPNLQKQGGLTVNVINSGFDLVFWKICSSNSKHLTKMCATQRTERNPRRMQAFLELQSWAQFPALRWFLSVSAGAPQHQGPSPVAQHP